ncbi:hypothetical protein DJICPGNB_17945 [Escherichia coli]|nr:hypothetical protein DJICPGNB_17945 [Escherichia coli]
MFYPAYIQSDPDGSSSGLFPDVPGCYFAGDTLDYAFQDAECVQRTSKPYARIE